MHTLLKQVYIIYIDCITSTTGAMQSLYGSGTQDVTITLLF